MGEKLEDGSGREFIDFEPVIQMIFEEDCDTLLILLPGFTKEQLKLQLSTAKILRLTGQRRGEDNKWIRLHKEFPISTNCDTKGITAKLLDGILYIRQPKLITPVEKQDKEKTLDESQKPVKPINDQPQPQKTDVEDHVGQETTRTADHTKQMEGQNGESMYAENIGKDNSGREKGREEGKSNGIAEDGRGTTRKMSNGVGNGGSDDGGRAVVLARMPLMNLVVVVILLALVLGIYVASKVKSAKEYGK
ncbi:hypothetical protein U1Q18_025316 [Sarracenia purpurea var. burkii]